MNERMTIRSVSAAVGAEILDLDLAGSLPESTIDEIRRALFQHGVVFFRSPTASSGARDRSPSGTTAARGTTRLTITTVSAA